MKNMYRYVALFHGFFTFMLLSGCASMVQTENGGVKDDAAADKIDPIVHVREGDKAAANGEFDNALVQYVIALEEDDKNAELYYKVGFIHQSQGRTDLAERSFQEALQISPEHVPARISLALIALRKKNYEYAELVLIQVLKQDPVNWRALNALGVLHDLREDFSNARGFYDRALVQAPGSVDVMNNLGYSLYLQSQWREAEEYFKKVVEKDPAYAHGWSNLALVYLQLGEESLAKIAFQNVVNEHQALNNIGYFSLLNKDMVSAREKFRDAAHLAPSYYALAYRNLASVDASESEASEVKPDHELIGSRSLGNASRLRSGEQDLRRVNKVANGQAVFEDTLLLRAPGQ